MVLAAPAIVTASSALAPGTCVPHGAAVIVRGTDGVVRGFANACRHRATRLVDAPCAAKALVCPYHGWTYDLAGALIHVPHAESFAGIDLATRHLAELPVAERHGLVWLGGDVDRHLGELGPDLAALELDRHVVYRDARVTRACNWKLLVEAFLDGYHIRSLHRDSVYRYFIDAASVSERVYVPWSLADRPAHLLEQIDGAVRELSTPSFMIFPATTVIAHPDFISILTFAPARHRIAPSSVTSCWCRRSRREAEHWDRNWQPIDGSVFARGPVMLSRSRSLAASSHSCSVLMSPVRWFRRDHGTVRRERAPRRQPGHR